jgi:hypothetical protein
VHAVKNELLFQKNDIMIFVEKVELCTKIKGHYTLKWFLKIPVFALYFKTALFTHRDQFGLSPSHSALRSLALRSPWHGRKESPK